MRESLGWEHVAVVISMVTRFHADKGLDEFLCMTQAVKDWAMQGQTHETAEQPVLKFVLVGRGMLADNPELQAAMATAGVTEAGVQLLGERRDMV